MFAGYAYEDATGGSTLVLLIFGQVALGGVRVVAFEADRRTEDAYVSDAGLLVETKAIIE